MGIITLLTDFGTRDHYVASMKGVIYCKAPRATVVDITHEISAHNIIEAAFVLRHSIVWYPTGTVHVAVVDPGVGSSRRILVGRYDGQIVLAPDNGLLSIVHRDLQLDELYVVEQERYFLPHVSGTFHGRDIFAPVAAHLATGLRLSMLGGRVGEPNVLPLASPKQSGDEIRGCVLYIDRFGNLITNIGASMIANELRRGESLVVYVGEKNVGPIRNSYGDVGQGELLALIGSSGTVEISVNTGRASDFLCVDVQPEVIVR